MKISELIKQLERVENKDLPIYVTLPPYSDNMAITGISLYDDNSKHDTSNPLGINIK